MTMKTPGGIGATTAGSRPTPAAPASSKPAGPATNPRVEAKKVPLLPPEPVEVIPELALTRGQKIAKFFRQNSSKLPIKDPFSTPDIAEDYVNEKLELGRVERTIKRLTFQACLVAVLGIGLAVGTPFFAPLYDYHSITPEGKTAILVPLELPNLTDPAVVNWAATSITEIMSFGFGDVEEKTAIQKLRFTKEGWKAFVKSFIQTKVSETFKKNQMVMTTVPSDTPVIISQGVNDDDVYEWKLQVPIITTYAANNNVIKPERATMELTIVRVPNGQSPAGIAIDIMRQIKH